jgi:adenylate kinase family enzyme
MLTGPVLERLCAARRILVLGPSGSGKTHLALQLGGLLDLPVIHLDAHRWRRGWVALPDAAWRSVVSELTQRPSWIMDGTYESTLDLRIPAADMIIVLELQRVLCVLGLLRRRFLGMRPRPDAPPGERIDLAFLRYVWHYPDVTRPLLLSQLDQYGEGKMVVVLRGRSETRPLADAVASATESQAGSRQASRADE